MRNPRIPPQKKTLPFLPPPSDTMRVRIRIGLFSERISSGFCAFSIFLEEGQPKPQPTTPQPEQGLAIEAPLKLLYLEQNVDSFEDMCDTFRARRQARDRGLSINTKEIAKGPLYGPIIFSHPGRDREHGRGLGRCTV